MRLTRETSPDGRCKYAIIRLDKLRLIPKEDQRKVQDILDSLPANLIEYGEKGSEEECFVIKLKDKHAPEALQAYSISVLTDIRGGSHPQYAADVLQLAIRAQHHPGKRTPD